MLFLDILFLKPSISVHRVNYSTYVPLVGTLCSALCSIVYKSCQSGGMPM
jgi:hypothetical protein